MSRLDPLPPRVAVRLLRAMLAPADRDYIIGDLVEQYHATIRPARGRVRADLWFWRQVWQSLGPSWRRRRDVARRRPPDPSPSSRQPLETLRQDIVFALRQVRRSPGFAIAVTLTLALGIGANTAIFSVVNGTLLHPLPYPEPDQLVYVTSRMPNAGVEATHLSPADFADIRDQIDGVDVASISETVVLPLTDDAGSETVVISRTSWRFFEVMGVPPALGQTFREADGIPIATGAAVPPRLVVLSHGLWQRRFGGDSAVVGRTLEVNGFPATIIGVMPASFRVHLPPIANIGSGIDLWWVNRFDYRTGARNALSSRVVGRLRPGVTAVQVERALAGLAGRLREEHDHHRQVGMQYTVHPLHEAVVGDVRGTLLVFLGAVGFVLLIACANVANLLMARGTGRRTELAVRSALGAGRHRIVRQILTESAVLSVAGAVAGLGMAAAGVALLKALRPPDLPLLANVGLNLPVLGFGIAATVGATLIYGIVPAAQYTRGNASETLGDRSLTGTRGQRYTQSALAVGEVALSIMLLAGAALMVRSFRELQTVPLGFDTERLLTVRTNTIPACTTGDGQFSCDRPLIEEEIERRIADLPGVRTVGSGFPLPMNGVYDRVAHYTPDETRADENAQREAFFRTVSPTYMEAMGIDLHIGRAFTPMDSDTTLPVVIIDETLARREWPGENPVGKKIALFGWGFDRPAPYEVIGVAEFVPQWNHRDRRPTIYVPREYYRSIELSVAVRATVDPATLTDAVRGAIRTVDRDLPVEFVDMRALIAAQLAPARFVLTLLTIFSAMALVLASIGLYGVLAYAVRQRTREIGIRMAFGAGRRRVVRDVVAHGSKLAGLGVILGLAGALAVSGTLERHLFGIQPHDPLALVLTAGLVLAIALIASLTPALRAARVDPMVALRSE